MITDQYGNKIYELDEIIKIVENDLSTINALILKNPISIIETLFPDTKRKIEAQTCLKSILFHLRKLKEHEKDTSQKP